MNAAIFNQRLLAVVADIRRAEEEYGKAIVKAATAERAYKRREALALVQVADFKNAAQQRAQAELLAFEDGATVGDLRYASHLADGVRDAAKQALRNRASEMSALQSEAALAKQEMWFEQTAPREALGP